MGVWKYIFCILSIFFKLICLIDFEVLMLMVEFWLINDRVLLVVFKIVFVLFLENFELNIFCVMLFICCF